MSLAQLPPLDFDSGGLRISLFPRSDSPPLIAPDPISGEPTVTDKERDSEAKPSIPERQRPQIPQNGDGSRDISRDTAPRVDDVGKQHGNTQDETEHLEARQPLKDDGDAENPFRDTASHDVEISDTEETTAPATGGQAIPTHPIASMQDAFEESLHEVTTGGAASKPKLRILDAKGRRERLLDQEKEEEPFDQLWRYRPGQHQHELLKLLAQISFGVYLLLNGMANSNSQVVTILQGHIDEVDEFLEVALEDLTQATIDLNGRIDYLKLPMSNMQVFEELLEDRNFRVEILEGNEKIEHILSRTNVALRQWDDDVEAGLTCSAGFTQWLTEQDNDSLRKDRPEVMDILDAMNGNAEGWQNAFDEMNSRTQELNNLIIKLMTIVAELEKKAGEISRRTWAKIPPFTIPSKSGTVSSISSPHSHRSNPKSTPQGSIRSGSISTPHVQKIDHQVDADSILDYPLPGAAPLLPPPRISARPVPRPSSSSSSARRPRELSVAAKSPPRSIDRSEVASHDSKSPSEEEPLYILQPRTYTPQPPEPSQPPAVQHSPRSQQSSRLADVSSEQQGLQKQTSLRQRVSQKGKAPVSIQIPPRNFAEGRSVHYDSSSFATPRTGASIHASSYGSDGESQPQHRHIPRIASHSDLSVPVRPPLMPSPRSDHQYYRPVQASPHSPLQQRPHTSGTGAAASQRHQSSYFTRQHVRNQPSRLGGMSMLSNVTNAQDDARTIATQRTARGTERTLKKKKSAFGWLKKAFSMDDEERAAYEARKAMQVDPQYFDDRSPKFLDGRRIR
ncbi:hypothetical protein LIA77_05168 [Sarocladium implicatum]|nr:hypothetical protein LIA77_05168 [Sarocladium implicatum]